MPENADFVSCRKRPFNESLPSSENTINVSTNKDELNNESPNFQCVSFIVTTFIVAMFFIPASLLVIRSAYLLPPKKKVTALCKCLSINVHEVLLQYRSPNYNRKTSSRISTTNYAYPSFTVKVQKECKRSSMHV